MNRPTSGFGVAEILAREAALACRLETLRMIAGLAGAAGVVALVIAMLAERDTLTALVAASPLGVTAIASGAAAVTRFQLRKVRLLLAVLDVDRRGERAVERRGPPDALRADESRPAGARDHGWGPTSRVASGQGGDSPTTSAAP